VEYVTSARLEKGVLTIRNRRQMDEALKRWQDCNCIVTIERAHATRSKAQNDYYHSVVVARIADKFKRDPKEMHEILKAVHLPHAKAQRGENGTLMNGYVIGGSTTKLNKLEFIEYLETIVQWAAERDIVIPDPDPDWRAHAEEEASKRVSDDVDRRQACHG
jgi:hypothetical protein